MSFFFFTVCLLGTLVLFSLSPLAIKGNEACNFSTLLISQKINAAESEDLLIKFDFDFAY